MPRFLPIVLVLISFIAACKKNENEPKVLLEGRWQPQSTRDFSYDAAGNLIRQGTASLPNSYYLLITKDSLLYRDVRDNSSLGSYKLTRQSSSLQFLRNYDCQVTELTSSKLVLRFKETGLAPNTAYRETEDEYTR